MKRTGLMVGLGIDTASAAVFVLGRVLSASNASTHCQAVPVVVAARDIPRGALIDSTAVYVAQWPAGTPPMGAYTTVDAVVGRISDRDVRQGDAFAPGRPTREQPTDHLDANTTRARAEGEW